MVNHKKYINVYKLKNIKGILLDFDGTIVPSEKVFLFTQQEVFNDKYGCVFTNEEYIKYELEMDTKLIDFLIASGRLNQNVEKYKIMQDVYNQYDVAFKKMLDTIDFCDTLNHIAEWQKNGIKIAIVSTSKRKYLNIFLNQYKDYMKFSCILCREDVRQLKPNPMIYLQALAMLRLAPIECLGIEDSVRGVSSAIAAKVNVVKVVENALTTSDFFLYQDIPVVNSIKDIIL